MKIYKTYFDKKDTPFSLKFQPKKQYHVVWKRNAYKSFLGHKVIKVKLFGLFTLSKLTGSPTSKLTDIIEKIIESKK